MSSSLYSSQIVEPYAQALMSVAQSSNLTDQFGDDLRSLASLLKESSELQEFVANPVIAIEQKKGVLRQILGDANPYLVNFMMLLVDKGRIIFLAEVCEQYLGALRKLKGIVLAEVTSVKELNEEQQRSVAEKAKQLTGANDVELKLTIDPSIIGGVIIKVGSQVFDASLRGQLRRISMRLNSAT